MMALWIHRISIASVSLGLCCAIVIAVDEWRHPQRMWIMSVVWPISALFGTVAWLWGYFHYGRLSVRTSDHRAKAARKKPFGIMVAEGTSHCGAGCTLGDICAEWLAVGFPVIATWLGWRTIFAEKMFAIWILDFLFAYAFGVVFQYYTIAPMRGLGPIDGLWAAIKADTLSLTAWQIGMYGFMAFAHFWLFRRWLGLELEVSSFEFWFMMQIAMLFGFATSYPVNGWLLKTGWKEKM